MEDNDEAMEDGGEAMAGVVELRGETVAGYRKAATENLGREIGRAHV